MVMPSGWRSSEPMPRAEHQRQRAEQRRHRRHQDRAEAQQAGLVDRLARRLAFVALGVEREVDHHDRVLLHDADQQDDADDGDDAEIVAERHQRKQRADAGRRQGRQDRDRMDVALVEHAQHDVHRDDGGEDQPAARWRAKTEMPAPRPGSWSATLAGSADVLLAQLRCLTASPSERRARD